MFLILNRKEDSCYEQPWTDVYCLVKVGELFKAVRKPEGGQSVKVNVFHKQAMN